MLGSILHLIVYTLMSVLLFFIVMRFVLQLVKADFYNPLSQAIVKGTQPLLRPFRKIIPGFFGIDFASIALIVIIQVIASTLLLLTLGFSITAVNPVAFILWGLLGAATYVTGILFIAMIISIIGSFIQQMHYHPVFMLATQIVEPFAKPIRKIIPPIGGVLDISPIFVLLGIQIANMLINYAAAALGVIPKVVLGYW